MTGEIAPPSFAGDLFLALAAEGRLVVDAAWADDMITTLEQTRSILRQRLRAVRGWQSPSGRGVCELTQGVVDALFIDQLAPGRLEESITELAKYAEALRLARCVPHPGEQ
ncbi:hypothetical protein [Micromonospora sp. NPDC005367]|uniref:hypothetical protein n=1 Tax=Micromonospora sp. NPDC005367 TaxID=3155590 RepID=UPI0033BDD41D